MHLIRQVRQRLFAECLLMRFCSAKKFILPDLSQQESNKYDLLMDFSMNKNAMRYKLQVMTAQNFQLS